MFELRFASPYEEQTLGKHSKAFGSPVELLRAKHHNEVAPRIRAWIPAYDSKSRVTSPLHCDARFGLPRGHLEPDSGYSAIARAVAVKAVEEGEENIDRLATIPVGFE
jgi:hypothetical protein